MYASSPVQMKPLKKIFVIKRQVAGTTYLNSSFLSHHTSFNLSMFTLAHCCLFIMRFHCMTLLFQHKNLTRGTMTEWQSTGLITRRSKPSQWASSLQYQGINPHYQDPWRGCYTYLHFRGSFFLWRFASVGFLKT